ncbi:DUF6286 domain-containing protein [Streptomyces roseoverticillatus]|uniref:DUF6286 domain-containing protein n=1 Tax=Streptomyces roseoverticillatus TaxID=66429 RepID=A0ABV3J2U1_9ACTN
MSGTEGGGAGGGEARGEVPGGRRFWAVRRVPAFLVAAVVLGAAGLLLYDVAAVRAHQPAMEWRRRLTHELATRPLGDGWVVGGAVVAVVVGLWLVLLAATPGLRSVLPMRPGRAGLRAGIDRRAAALVLRDRAMEVSGVQSVRVKVGRRRVTVRAQSHFRDLDDVRADVEGVMAEGVRKLGLAREPGVSVRVGRPVKK